MFKLDRVTLDPQLMEGQACIRGMRVSVLIILNLIANNVTAGEIL